MPGGDGTGPAGLGPMTGRAAGYCAGYPGPGYMSPMPGRGLGFGGGRGFGRGLGLGFRGGHGWAGRWAAPYAAPVPYASAATVPGAQQELEPLKGQAEYFGNALESIRQRISELEAQKAETE